MMKISKHIFFKENYFVNENLANFGRFKNILFWNGILKIKWLFDKDLMNLLLDYGMWQSNQGIIYNHIYIYWSSFCTHKLLSGRHIALEAAWEVATNLQQNGTPRRELTPCYLVFFLFRYWLLVVISCRRRLIASYYLQ
jgi:hypothetical protein